MVNFGEQATFRTDGASRVVQSAFDGVYYSHDPVLLVLPCLIEKSLKEVKAVNVEVVFDPPWDMSRMSEAARLQLGF